MPSSVQADFRKFSELTTRLGRVSEGWTSPAGLRGIEQVRELVETGNRDALLRGLDRNGVPMVPVKDPTAPSRGGTGPPMSPKGPASRFSVTFRARVARRGDTVVVEGGWPADVARITGYHRRGAGNLPVRDIIGIRPAERSRIREINVTTARRIARAES